MSRYYEVSWELENSNPCEISKILSEILDLEDGYRTGDTWIGYGELRLSGGASPKDYGDATADKIFKLIGRKFPINFSVTAQSPTDTFSFGGDD